MSLRSMSLRSKSSSDVASGGGLSGSTLSRRAVLTTWVLLLLGSALPVPLARAALMINEVLYDPEGPDRGAEWVEIHNTGPWPATLDGVALEAGDGSGPGRWTRTWEGTPGEWIEAGGFCAVGGPWRGRTACSPGVLELQNGPDGVRLVREGLELDRVGWGELAQREYCEGNPAGAVGSGKSLARREDGVDTDDNSADFAAAAPTPGTWNHPARDLAVGLARPGPPIPLSGGEGELRAVVRLENRGTSEVSAADIRLVVDGRTVLPDSARLLGPLAPGSTIDLEVSLDRAGDPGVRVWTCLVRWSEDLVSEDDADTLRGWAGPSPLRLAEIAPRPRAGGTEWIELESAGGAVSMEGWSVRDRSGTRLVLRGREVPAPGTRIVVARDSAAAVADGFVAAAWDGAWPTLNDTAAKGQGADTLWLADPTGLVTDWAVYGTTAAGETWVRLEGAPNDAGLDAWVAADGPSGGTPGRTNPPSASTRPLLFEYPAESAAISLERDRGGAWIPLPSVPSGSRRWLRILRLDGSTAAEFEAAPGAAESWARWDGRAPDGRACPAGVYLLETRVIDGEGRTQTTRHPLVVGR
jgi:hypothetical protein